MDGAAPNLTYTPDANFFGEDSFTFKVSDGAHDSAPAVISITVEPVNDPPSFDLLASPDQTASADAGVQTVPTFATNILAGPPNGFEDGQSVAFLASNENDALFSSPPAINQSGTLTYEPLPGADGQASVHIQAQDDGGTANGGEDTSIVKTFTITIHASGAPGS